MILFRILDEHITFEIGNIEPSSTVVITYSALARIDIEANKTLSNHASSMRNA